jgi:hypothetical protein
MRFHIYSRGGHRVWDFSVFPTQDVMKVFQTKEHLVLHTYETGGVSNGDGL